MEAEQYTIKHMASGEQETISLDKIIEKLR